MSAGSPNWIKLAEMGKLPKEARGKIPMLAQLDKAEARIEEIKKSVCDECREKVFRDESVKTEAPGKVVGQDATGHTQVKCEVEKCKFIAEGKSEAVAKNNLRLHNRSHEVKE